MPATRALEAQSGPETSHGNVRHVHGVVEDSVTGQPLNGAEITVQPVSPIGASGKLSSAPVRLRSDRNGRFDFRDLPAGVIRLRARALGYMPIERLIDLTAGDRLITLHLMTATTVLEELTIRADTLAERLGRVVATNTLDRAALASTRGQTLGETIKNLPGVTVVQFGPSIAKPVIRGLNSQRVLVLNAGVKQESQQWGTEHAPNIDSFDASSVTVVRGAGTVLYGADALGGVVRVDREAVPDTGGVHGDLALNTFSNSRQGALSIGVQGSALPLPLLGKTGYRLRLTTRVAGNAAAPDYFLDNTGFRELNGSLALGTSRGWGSTELLLSRFAAELGVLQQAHVGNVEDLERAMTSAPRDSGFTFGIGRPSQRVEHTTLRVRTLLDLPRDGELEVVYGLQFNHRREFDNNGPLRFRDEAAFNLKLFTNSLDVRYTHARWNNLRGTVGISGIAQGNQTLGKAFLIPGYDLWQGAVYAQEELSAGRWSITAGARGDLISQTTIAFDDQGIRSEAGTRAWRDMSGSLGVAYLLADGLDVSVRFARAWRPPTVNERFAQGVHAGSAQFELGDARLDEERSQGFETSLRYRRTRFTLEAAAYDNRLSNFIFLEPTAPVQTIRGAFPGFRYAQTRARLRGVELSSVWTPHQRVEIQASGTAVRGTDLVRADALFDMPADRALLSVRTTGSREILGSWFAGIGTTLVRKQDGVPDGTIFTLPTAGYALLNLDAGTRAFRLAGRTLDISLSVNNVLNTRYRDYLSRYRLFVDDVGRDVVLRFTAPF